MPGGANNQSDELSIQESWPLSFALSKSPLQRSAGGLWSPTFSSPQSSQLPSSLPSLPLLSRSDIQPKTTLLPGKTLGQSSNQILFSITVLQAHFEKMTRETLEVRFNKRFNLIDIWHLTFNICYGWIGWLLWHQLHWMILFKRLRVTLVSSIASMGWLQVSRSGLCWIYIW